MRIMSPDAYKKRLLAAARARLAAARASRPVKESVARRENIAPVAKIADTGLIPASLLYPDLTDEQFITRQFADFLSRVPSRQELERWMSLLRNNSREAVNDEIAYCDEVVRRAKFPKNDYLVNEAVLSRPDLKVAVLLCGHLRTFQQTYPAINSNLVLPLNADVYIHTWDALGTQRFDPIMGPIPQESEHISEQSIRNVISNIQGLRIENNAQFIKTAKIANSKPFVFGERSGRIFSAQPVFIESQLYSLYAASRLMLDGETRLGKKYDLVIKLRSDMSVMERLQCSGEIRMNDLWVPSLPRGNHGHPVCFACMRGQHSGRHASDVCDVYAYGGRDAMLNYCSIWENLEELYKRMCDENAVNIKKPGAVYGNRDGFTTVPIWTNGATHRLHCFYPERMFRLYLEGWHLRPGTLACKVIR